MSQPLAERVALITGASSGIGRATAVAFAEPGPCCLQRPDHAGRGRSGGRGDSQSRRKALLCPLDITDQPAEERMVADVERQLGGLDYFVSSAVYSDREPFHTADLEASARRST